MRRNRRGYLWAIPAFVLLVAVSGSWATASGMDWYRTISLPRWMPPDGTIRTVWLFVHLAGFIVGLGAVTVIDLLGFLGRASCYWTETTIRAHKVTKPLIWIGISLAILGGAFWHGAWTPVASAQAVIALALILNGCFLTFVVSPFLLARESAGCPREILPAWMQRRITVSFLVSFVGWWSALALTVLVLAA